MNCRWIYPVSQIPKYVAQYAEKRSCRRVINVLAEISGGNAGEETARNWLKRAIEASGMDYSDSFRSLRSLSRGVILCLVALTLLENC